MLLRSCRSCSEMQNDLSAQYVTISNTDYWLLATEGKAPCRRFKSCSKDLGLSLLHQSKGVLVGPCGALKAGTWERLLTSKRPQPFMSSDASPSVADHILPLGNGGNIRREETGTLVNIPAWVRLKSRASTSASTQQVEGSQWGQLVSTTSLDSARS